MKWDSIKSRLLLMTTLCVLGLGLMTINQHYFGQKLSELNGQHAELQQLQTDLLQLRRHEKDFLLRRNPLYLDRFREQYQTFINTVARLDNVVSQYGLANVLVSDIAVNTEAYAQHFYQLADIMKQYGLNAESGINGELRRLSLDLNNNTEGLTPTAIGEIGSVTYLAADYQLTSSPETLLKLQQEINSVGE